jgi:predicted Rossmann fold nucleotide-binding protein DprA/Smf involved in DNA uptake
MATPLSQIYPPENTELAERIVSMGGLLVTEYTTTAYAPYRFVDRDYLQALLSLAVIPIQADVKSGTRHACHAALDNGIHLFVPVPVVHDEKQYPKQYGLIRELLKDERVVPFRGRQEYPKLLEVLRG